LALDDKSWSHDARLGETLKCTCSGELVKLSMSNFSGQGSNWDAFSPISNITILGLLSQTFVVRGATHCFSSAHSIPKNTTPNKTIRHVASTLSIPIRKPTRWWERTTRRNAIKYPHDGIEQDGAKHRWVGSSDLSKGVRKDKPRPNKHWALTFLPPSLFFSLTRKFRYQLDRVMLNQNGSRDRAETSHSLPSHLFDRISPLWTFATISNVFNPSSGSRYTYPTA